MSATTDGQWLGLLLGALALIGVIVTIVYHDGDAP